APGTRETALLDPVNMVDKVNAISLAGGSAFGLDAASGVMKYLDERKIGWNVGTAGVVPIVPSAILIDLWFGGDPKIRPTADCGYRAAMSATSDRVQEGNVGAGAGATVGAIVAVNAVGDVIDPDTGRVVAGMRSADGKSLVDVRKLIREGAFSRAV